MFQSLKLSRGPSFDSQEQIQGLKEVNFFYGPNGSGKTTITRILHSLKPGECESELPLSDYSVKVFNQQYVREAFAVDAQMPGVFRLAERAVEFQNKLSDLSKQQDEAMAYIANLRVKIGGSSDEGGPSGLLGQLEQLTNSVKEKVWECRKQLPEILTSNLPCSRSKTRNLDMVLEAYSRDKPIQELDEVVKDAEVAFAEQLDEVDELDDFNLSFPDYDEVQSLAAEPILTQADTAFGELVTRLSHSEWVAQGLRLTKDNDLHLCPFCHQGINKGVLESLEELFDDLYTQSLERLRVALEQIKNLRKSVDEKIEGDQGTIRRFGSGQETLGLIANYKTVLESLELEIQNKIMHPSSVITLPDIAGEHARIEGAYGHINEKIAHHNNLVKNNQKSRVAVTEATFGIVAHQMALKEIAEYETSRKNLESEISGRRKTLADQEAKLVEVQQNISALQEESSNVHSVANSINGLLKSVGFHGFSLKTTDEKSPRYQLVRGDELASSETLSEGEKTFLAFLYYYHSLHNEGEEKRQRRATIAVIDDPISSLDSGTLFHVASLVRLLMSDVESGKGSVGQLFLLTHNSYYYREISYYPQKRQPGSRRFYSLRKKWGRNTVVEGPSDRPLNRTDYEALWDVLYEIQASSGPAPAYLPNTMRRIFETYFGFTLGGETKFLDRLPDSEKVLAKSLTAWINTGSHVPEIGAAYTPAANCDQWVRTFRMCFDEAGHGDHYEHMMKDCQLWSERSGQ